mgnify:CR=1 FL=1
MQEIPHIIHYCWFGKNPLPEDAKKCIRSWKMFCPDYEIREWNESNYKVQDKCQYVQQAYKAGKWAFVSDYARFDIISQYGGIYLDTDVELIASIDDIVSKGAFLGCEWADVLERRVQVNTGIGFGLPPEHWLCKMILKQYEKDCFIFPSGRYNPNNVVERISRILLEKGFSGKNKLEMADDLSIYPTEYFCPLNYFSGELKKTENTRSIHHYTATWRTKYEKASTLILAKMVKCFGYKIGSRLGKVLTLPVWAAGKVSEKGFVGFLRYCKRRLSGMQ